jgi:hypothetical protein
MRAPATILLLAALAAPAAVAGAVPSAVAEALGRAAPLPGARVEVEDFRPEVPAGCAVTRAELPAPLAGSGRVAVRISGTLPGGEACEGWGWAAVRVLSTALIAHRTVPAGSPLQDAVTPREQELRGGRPPLARLPAGAVAGRPIAAGQVVEERDLRLGPAAGDEVIVIVRLGSLRVEQAGRAVPCSRGHACAQMPSGKRVEGTWLDGRIVVESP